MKFNNLLTIYHLPWGNKSTEIVKRWFRNNFVARTNLVVDSDLENKFPNLEDIHALYPYIKTCTVVINPYARALIKYDWTKSNNTNIKVDTFEDFLKLLLKNKANKSNLIFKSQTDIIQYRKNNKLIKTDFILKRENLTNDFKQIQKFVKSYSPLVIRDNESNFPYKNRYTEKEISLVAKLYKDDLENFNYSF